MLKTSGICSRRLATHAECWRRTALLTTAGRSWGERSWTWTESGSGSNWTSSWSRRDRWGSTVLYYTVLFCNVLYFTILYCTLLHFLLYRLVSAGEGAVVTTCWCTQPDAALHIQPWDHGEDVEDAKQGQATTTTVRQANSVKQDSIHPPQPARCAFSLPLAATPWDPAPSILSVQS